MTVQEIQEKHSNLEKLTSKEFYNWAIAQNEVSLMGYIKIFKERLTWDAPNSKHFVPVYTKEETLEQIVIMLDILEVEYNILI